MALILNGTDGLSDVDGTAATPAIRGTDTNTGIFFPAADTIAFAEGGTEVARFDSSGNLGVGTASPTARLHVFGGQSYVTGASGAGAYSRWYNNAQTTNDFQIGQGWSSASDNVAVINNNANAAMIFGTNGSERMRIDSSGRLLLNTTSVIADGLQSVQFAGATQNGISLRTTLASTGSNYLHFSNSAGSTTGFVTQNGTTTVSYTTSSDYRLKENVVAMTGALAKVALLKPCTYTWKEDGSDGQGFIAHELQEVCPDAVVGEKDAVDSEGNIKPQGIDTSFLVATLTAAIQELKSTVDAQAARIAALENPPVESVTNE